MFSKCSFTQQRTFFTHYCHNVLDPFGGQFLLQETGLFELAFYEMTRFFLLKCKTRSKMQFCPPKCPLFYTFSSFGKNLSDFCILCHSKIFSRLDSEITYAWKISKKLQPSFFFMFKFFSWSSQVSHNFSFFFSNFTS